MLNEAWYAEESSRARAMAEAGDVHTAVVSLTCVAETTTESNRQYSPRVACRLKPVMVRLVPPCFGPRKGVTDVMLYVAM